MGKKVKVYIALLVGFIILFFYWQKRESDKAQSIKESQFQSAIGSAAEDFSYYLEANNTVSYWYGISNLKAASWVLNWFPEDSVPYMTMRDFITLHGYMVVSPEVAKKYLPELIDLFLRLQKDINDNAAFMMMLDYSNRISHEISENSLKSNGNDNELTPTPPPNAQPYAIYYDNQLYLYSSDLELTEESILSLNLLGEVTDLVPSNELPSTHLQTNMNCLLPTPLFAYQQDDTFHLVMEVNWVYGTNQVHKYVIFTREEDN